MAGVQMIVPAEARYVRAIRLVAASLAADIGFDVDELDDIRVAVDELCTLFRPRGSNGSIELELVTTAGTELVVTGRYRGDGDVVEADWLVAEILAATADDFELPTPASPAFRYIRRHAR
jgi:hypothetical protein